MFPSVWLSFGGGAVLALSIAILSSFASASPNYKVTVSFKSCQDSLSSAPPAAPEFTPLDYELSDLEGTFFAFLEKVQSSGSVPAARAEYFLKDVLSLKADILNQVFDLLPQVIRSPMDPAKKARAMNSIYQIVDSLGIPAQVFGFRILRDGRVIFPSAPPQRIPRMVRPVLPKVNPIGFTTREPGSRDLPDDQHRSIGFGAHEIRGEVPPQREVGQISRSLENGKAPVLVVTDEINKKTFRLPLAHLIFSEVTLEGSKYELQFNPEVMEWVVTRDNLNNPSGRIGF